MKLLTITTVTFAIMLLSVNVAAQRRPSVNVVLPPNADKDFQNSTYLVVTNANMFFELHCSAHFPIQWVSYFEPSDDGNLASSVWAETRRNVTHFEDPSTYTYTAILSLTYTGKLQVFANFSCQAVHSWEWQTNVITTSVPRRDVVFMTITSAVQLYPVGQSRPAEPCNTLVVAARLENAPGCWKCVTDQGMELPLDFYSCENPLDCNIFYQRQKRGKDCLRISADADTCKVATKDFNAKMVACKNHGVALVQFYFFSVVPSPNGTPYIYFAWDEMDLSKMLRLDPITNSLIVGDKATFSCELSKFAFSLGAWFGIEVEHRGWRYFEAAEPPSRSETGDDEYAQSGTFVRNVTVTVPRGLRKVRCYGPVWNSAEWAISEAKVVVEDAQAPSVDLPTKDIEVAAVLGDSSKILTCHFSGNPFPKIVWIVPVSGQSLVEISTKKEMMLTELHIREVTHASAGTYECQLTSFLGTATRKFTVTVTDAYKSTLTITAGVMVPLLLTVIIVILFGWRKIKRQKVALRLLTEAEVKEFVEGNPDLVKNHEYLNDSVAISAVPFDQNKYEIPLEDFRIDYSTVLGSGAFGVVYCGTIKSKEVRYVAIKTLRRDVDVETFKALLGEIKIMAYLGPHKNVVSLIGASTSNIRNRQALVAFEFCEKGSLDKYLQNRRSLFVNYVTHGKLDVQKAVSSNVDDYTNALGQSFTTFDLFKWVYDIASGMEYLRERKVIHGDLAIRNVLLTAEATCKIGDFGLSRQLINTPNYFKKTHCPLPWRWMSPESLTEMRFSVQSDTWAFGVTLWELFTLGDTPYKGYSYTVEFSTELQSGLRLDKPVYATNHIYEYMFKCWDLVTERRPSMEEIKRIASEGLKDFLPEGYFDSGVVPNNMSKSQAHNAGESETCNANPNLAPTTVGGNGYVAPAFDNCDESEAEPETQNDGYEVPLKQKM